jgi:hypothetical protein
MFLNEIEVTEGLVVGNRPETSYNERPREA